MQCRYVRHTMSNVCVMVRCAETKKFSLLPQKGWEKEGGLGWERECMLLPQGKKQHRKKAHICCP